MPNTRTLQTSFAAGELSPEMAARLDVAQRLAGVGLMRNNIARPQGPASRRPAFEYVNQARNQAAASRLIPFVFSTDQALVLEFGEQVIRFHTLGATLLHATPRVIGDETQFNLVDNEIRFLAPHGFAVSDEIVIIARPGDVMPVGITSGQVYPVLNVVDALTIEIGPLSGSPSGFFRAFLASEFPRSYIGSRTFDFTDVDTGAETITLGAHDFQEGDAVRFSSTGVLPGDIVEDPWVATRDYYVTNPTATTIQVASSVGGGALNIVSQGTGTHTIAYRYKRTEMAFIPAAGGSYSDNAILYCTEEHSSEATYPTVPTADFWWQETGDGVYAIPSPYTAAQLSEINYVQSNDVLTLVHPEHPPKELRRLGAVSWEIVDIVFSSPLPAPSSVSVDIQRGQKLTIEIMDDTTFGFDLYRFTQAHNFAQADIVYVENVGGTSGLISDQYYLVDRTLTGPSGEFTDAYFRGIDGTPVNDGTPGPIASQADVYIADYWSTTDQEYVITAVDERQVETEPSTAIAADNVIDVDGAYNDVGWAAVPGAVRYNVYRKEGGVFGYLGQTEGTLFRDDGNVQPDTARTPPIVDGDLSGTSYPRSVCYYEQRRVFGGLTGSPRQLLFTRSGTEAALTYRIPVQDDDRISIELAARDAATIRHLVPIQDILALTQDGTFSVGPLGGDALTPDTAAARPQGTTGASFVRPIVDGNTCLYGSQRSKHVYRVGFDWRSQSYEPRDMSLRAAHLFDGATLTDSTLSKAPFPVAWWVSSSGKLLGLTHIPEEEVVAWHQHDTQGGTFETACAIPEGDIDVLYVGVNRGGVRTIERARLVADPDPSDAVLDSRLTFDGTETAERPLWLEDGELWQPGEAVRIVSSDTVFSGLGDIGNQIEFRDTAGGAYRVRITKVLGIGEAEGKLVDAFPESLRFFANATTNWAYCARRIALPASMTGEVQVVADGVELGAFTVVDDAVTIPRPAALVHVGYQVVSDIRTLPPALQIDGAGQGRTYNVNRAFVRVEGARGIDVGPTATQLTPVLDLEGEESLGGEYRVTIPGKWADGTVLVRASSAAPATIVGVTLEVSIGD